MRRNLWILFGLIIVVIAFGVIIDMPQGPLWGQKIKTSLGLDLVGGTELVYQADLSQSSNKTQDITNLSNVFRNRIDQLGVAEPSIQTAGANRIIIDLPGIKNIDEAISKIGSTYELIFYAQGAETDGVQFQGYYETGYTYPGYWTKTDLTGRDLIVDKTEVTFQNGQNQVASSAPVVAISFNDAGRQKFAKLTKDNLNKQIAIVLDNKIVSAPNVQTEISDGNAVITGSKDVKEAQKLVDRLKEGALPVSASLIGQENIGASLGQNSLKKSFVAGIIGLLLVAIFMVVYYKFSGLIAVVALMIYTLITLAIYKLIPVTLTLAGIAGFILSIGMAIDANILIFERMKEELHSGKTISLAIIDGFKRAWTSVRDSNFSSLITCLILYFTAGSGPVRGFALTLGIGILISLFTAVTVTRTILLLIAGSSAKRIISV